MVIGNYCNAAIDCDSDEMCMNGTCQKALRDISTESSEQKDDKIGNGDHMTGSTGRIGEKDKF